MITAKAFAGKHYAVYGLARSGLATAQALLASGATQSNLVLDCRVAFGSSQ